MKKVVFKELTSAYPSITVGKEYDVTEEQPCMTGCTVHIYINDAGVKDGAHYITNDTKLPFVIVEKEQSLPEEYIVDCTECTEPQRHEVVEEFTKYVNGTVEKELKEQKIWKFFIFEKTKAAHHFDQENVRKNDYPTISYSKWKELYNKTTKTENMKKYVIPTENGLKYYSHLLTKGKEYEIVINGGGNYEITTDKGNRQFFHPDYVKLVEKAEKKIIGYKLKEGFTEEVTKRIVSYYVKGAKGSYDFAINSGNYENFQKANLLDVMFDAVYEPEKPKTLEIELKGAKLSIYKDGLVSFKFNGNSGETSIEILEGIVKHSTYKNKVGIYTVTASSIHIGCSDGIDLTIKQVQNIIDQYNKFK